MALKTDRPPTHRPHPITRAELARRVGRSKATITLSLKKSLAAACLPNNRVDAAHPVLQTFARRYWDVGPEVLTADRTNVPLLPAVTAPKVDRTPRIAGMAEFAEMVGIPVEQVIDDFSRPPLSDAVIPEAHVTIDTFAVLAEVPASKVRRACRAELAAALTPLGLLDLVHPAALAFMNAHLFSGTSDHYPLGEAVVGDMIDIDHAIARVFLARCGIAEGRPP